MLANTIPQYLGSTNVLPMQQAPLQTSIPLVKPKQAMGKKLHNILIKAKGCRRML
jgi:hypothetical protein